MIYASDYGFLPGTDGMENARALQRAADMGGDIYVDRVGVYDVSDTIVLKSGTRLVFCAGSEVRRHETPDGETAYLFINRGAYTREWDEQIEIRGLHLTTGGVCSDPAREGQKKVITGLSAQLAFSFIRDLVVEGYVVKDLPAESFGVQVCTFENARFENLWIEGRKDGVHLGRGRKFVIRHAVFRTFDDPIALNAHDYSTSNPQMGWIEDGVIEDCYDLDDEDTTGFFCRVLAGSWLPWREGMVVQRSDSVVYSGRVYRVVMPPDGRTFVSRTPPCHEEGLATYDGIQWCMAQADETLSCGCRNIVFRDIHLQKKRPVAFSLHFDKDVWSRSYYPNSEAPVQDNITFENVWVENDVPVFLSTKTPVGTVRVKDCRLGGSVFRFRHVGDEGITYPRTRLILDGNEYTPIPGVRVEAGEGTAVDVYAGMRVPADEELKTQGDCVRF